MSDGLKLLVRKDVNGGVAFIWSTKEKRADISVDQDGWTALRDTRGEDDRAIWTDEGDTTIDAAYEAVSEFMGFPADGSDYVPVEIVAGLKATISALAILASEAADCEMTLDTRTTAFMSDEWLLRYADAMATVPEDCKPASMREEEE